MLLIALCPQTTKRSVCLQVIAGDWQPFSGRQKDRGKQQFTERWCMIKRESSIDFPPIVFAPFATIKYGFCATAISTLSWNWHFLYKGAVAFSIKPRVKGEISLTSPETARLICFWSGTSHTRTAQQLALWVARESNRVLEMLWRKMWASHCGRISPLAHTERQIIFNRKSLCFIRNMLWIL